MAWNKHTTPAFSLKLPDSPGPNLFPTSMVAFKIQLPYQFWPEGNVREFPAELLRTHSSLFLNNYSNTISQWHGAGQPGNPYALLSKDVSHTGNLGCWQILPRPAPNKKPRKGDFGTRSERTGCVKSESQSPCGQMQTDRVLYVQHKNEVHGRVGK